MTVPRFGMQRAAHTLVRHAARVAPPERAEWFEAMTNEMSHLPQGTCATRWAFGCVFVSYTERMRAMTRSTPTLSRWILALEMMACFVPLTFLFSAVVLSATGGTMSVREGLLFGSITMAGPLGLGVAIAAMLLKPRPVNS